MKYIVMQMLRIWMDSFRLRMKTVIILTALFPLTSLPALAQPPKPGAEEFVPQGLVAYDTNYLLGEGRDFIVFKIRNDGTRTISHLFGWVYRYNESPQGATDFLLMNNPHQSAFLIKGGPHRSGKVAQWRFSLNSIIPPNANERFILRVSPKSVFFAHHEPAPAPPEDR